MLPILETPKGNSHFSSNAININGNFQPDPKVIVRIAKAFYEKSCLKITQIHFFSRTNWSSIKKYLDWLENDGYLEYDERDKCYNPTESGWSIFRQISMFYDRFDFKNGKPLILT